MPVENKSYPPSAEMIMRAAYDALVKKQYDKIDQVIDKHPSSFTQQQHTKTTLFEAVEKMLGDNLHIRDESTRPHVVGLIVEGLEHIFSRVSDRLGPDLLGDWVHFTCNHISHTSLLSKGGTLLDIIENYAGINRETPYMDKSYKDLYVLAKKYGLENKSTAMQERIKQSIPSKGEGRTV